MSKYNKMIWQIIEKKIMTNNRKINKVLLIYPFNIIDSYNMDDIKTKNIELQPPLGLGYISSYFKKNSDIEISIFDANAEAIRSCLKSNLKIDNNIDMHKLWQMVENKIIDYDPDLVGISCLFHTTAQSTIKTAAIIRDISNKKMKKIYTIIGGNHAHVSYNDMLKDDNIDFVIFSEGEITLLNLVNAINNIDTNLQNVKGIAYKKGDTIIITDQERLIEVDKVDCDRSEFDIPFYSNHGRFFTSRFFDNNDIDNNRKNTNITTLIASRGCPHRCTFCSAQLTWKGKIRYRDPSLVVDEMLDLKNRFNINIFYLVDDNMSANRNDILKLTKEIKERIPNINWVSLAGMQIFTLKEDVIRSIYESGCKWFILPIESGNLDTLKKIRKHHTLEMVEKVIQDIRKYDDTWIAGNIMTGLPFESKTDIEYSLNYAKKLDLDWLYIFRFMPLPGTEIYQECLNAGYLSKNIPRYIGELPILNTPNFDATYIADKNYETNAEYNFFKNRNIKLRPEQAIRDFKYVLNTSKDNPLATWGMGKSYEEMKNYKEAKKWFIKTLKILENKNNDKDNYENKYIKKSKSDIGKSFFVVRDNIYYKKYFDIAGIDINDKIKEIEIKIKNR